MKNYLVNQPFIFSFGKKSPGFILSIIAIVFMASCKKEIQENFNGGIISDSTSARALAAEAAINNTYYVATNGNDANPGTINSPFASWEKLEEVLVPGDVAYIRGGNYTSPRPASDEYKVWWQNINGTEVSPIIIQNYPGESPVLNFSAQLFSTPGVYGLYMQSSSYVRLKGLRVTGLAQNPNGNAVNVFTLDNCNKITVELCEFDNSGGTGLVLLHSTNNLILNCDSHHLGDGFSPGYNWGGTNGFAVTASHNTSTNNTFRGCRAWEVSDNGWAFFNQGGVAIMENCWAFRIGWQPGTKLTGGDGVGYKLGPGNGQSTSVIRTLRNCIAAENRFQGFDENFNGDNQYVVQIDNCTAYKNGLGNGVVSNGYTYKEGYNFAFYQNNRANIFRNNIGYISANNAPINAQSIQTTNSWSGSVSVSDADFLSVSSLGMDGPRQADGSLPNLNFLKLASGSDLINAGTNVGLPFTGSAPDMGFFENGTTQPTNQTPSANAGADKNITLPSSSTLISGSGSDPDGSIVSYIWSFRTGPNIPVLSGTTTTTLTTSNLIAGTYVLRLTVTDNEGLTAYDEVTVSVAAATIIILPPQVGNSINVSQSSSNGGYGYYVAQNFGTPGDNVTNGTQSVLKIFENGVQLNPAHSPHADIRNIGRSRFSHWGNELYFSASDNSNPKINGRSYTYTITAAISNQAPVANAGADKTITLPNNNTSITGSGSDADGTIASYAWTFRSGPNAPALSGINTTILTTGNLKAGTYVFRLTVTDNGGLTAYDEVNVIVKASTAKTINVSQASSNGGFAYYVAKNFGTPGDDLTNGTQSVLKIFENGVQLNPAHSSHADIRNIGKGRFSHWGNELYFSASDNTSPKTNGRTYTYTIQ